MFFASFNLIFHIHQFSINFSPSAPCITFATTSLRSTLNRCPYIQTVPFEKKRRSASKTENKKLQNFEKISNSAKLAKFLLKKWTISAEKISKVE